MPGINFRSDHAGIARILRTEFAEPVSKLAAHVAAIAEGETHALPNGPFPIKVDRYETDRDAAAVMIAHPAGSAVEGKYHVLKRAAGLAGLTVKEPKRHG